MAVPKRGEDERTVRVHCPRLGRNLPVNEHAGCSYCFADVETITKGEHGGFCDFNAEKDPICFGFPDDHGRYRNR